MKQFYEWRNKSPCPGFIEMRKHQPFRNKMEIDFDSILNTKGSADRKREEPLEDPDHEIKREHVNEEYINVLYGLALQY